MPPENASTSAPLLREARYSLKEMLREVEHERRNSVLGIELVDQSEIGVIFKARGKKTPVKKK
ncbi:MAG TPA: hypothetical protein VK737_07605 [Opitutales bacterium]|jgi:hypothetical protein|nr:hypothetical protein [Opitutales bacterium]